MKILDIALSDLKVYENNPRKISEKAIEAVASSIKEFGLQHQQTRSTAKTRKAKDKSHAENVKKANEELKPKEIQPCTDEEADTE